MLLLFIIGSRKGSQFFGRIYNKTVEDGKNYPAPDENHVIIRMEHEIHRIKGDLILDNAFDEDFMNKIFEQRVKVLSKKDNSNFIKEYFSSNLIFPKIHTLKHKIGDVERSTDYFINNYMDYFLAGLKCEKFVNKYKTLTVSDLSEKSKKILTVLNEKEKIY